jgi:hypothetical protein
MPQEGVELNPQSKWLADWRIALVGRVAGIALLVWYFHLFLGHYIDDAFITLSYASTLAKFGVWGMAPDLTSNAATSPLNVMLLALFIKVFRDPLIALWMFNVFLGLVIYSSLRYFSLKIFGGETFGVLTTALLLVNPLLNATQGLESYLLIALVLLACQFWDRQWYRALGLVLGGLFLTRPDALAVAAVFVGLLLVRRQWSKALQVSGFFLIPVLPWLSYSWYHLGSLVPDTLLIKLGEKGWGKDHFLQGPILYWRKTPTAVLLSLALAPALLYLRPDRLLMRKRNDPSAALFLGLGTYAVLHFVAYSCLRVPPYHWYYAVEICAVVVFGTLALFQASATYRVTNLAILGLIITISAGFVISMATIKRNAALSTNWGTPDQYRDMALWINQHVPDKRIILDSELGTLQYYTDADTINGFSDRVPIVELLARPHSRIGGTLLRWNYRHLHTEDFSNLRYELTVCVAGVNAEMQWTTETPAVGKHWWCLYKRALPEQH